MGALFDTSALIAGERGAGAVERVLGAEIESKVSAITIAEFAKGVERASTAAVRRRREEELAALLEVFAVVDVDLRVARTAALVWADLERRGWLIPAFDLVIAATAMTYDWPLVTSDAHFRRVDGLALVEIPSSDAS